MVLQAVARCSLSLPTATTARQPNSASQGGSSPTELLSRGLFSSFNPSPLYPLLSPVTTTQRSITEGSFEQWDEEAEEECGFIFSCFTTQCAIEIRTFVVLHYYYKHICRDRRLFCSSTNYHGHCGPWWNRFINSKILIGDDCAH